MNNLYVKNCPISLPDYIFHRSCAEKLSSAKLFRKKLSQQVVFLQAYDELMPKLCEKFSWKLCSKLSFSKKAKKKICIKLIPAVLKNYPIKTWFEKI